MEKRQHYLDVIGCIGKAEMSVFRNMLLNEIVCAAILGGDNPMAVRTSADGEVSVSPYLFFDCAPGNKAFKITVQFYGWNSNGPANPEIVVRYRDKNDGLIDSNIQEYGPDEDELRTVEFELDAGADFDGYLTIETADAKGRFKKAVTKLTKVDA